MTLVYNSILRTRLLSPTYSGQLKPEAGTDQWYRRLPTNSSPGFESQLFGVMCVCLCGNKILVKLVIQRKNSFLESCHNFFNGLWRIQTIAGRVHDTAIQRICIIFKLFAWRLRPQLGTAQPAGIHRQSVLPSDIPPNNLNMKLKKWKNSRPREDFYKTKLSKYVS